MTMTTIQEHAKTAAARIREKGWWDGRLSGNGGNGGSECLLTAIECDDKDLMRATGKAIARKLGISTDDGYWGIELTKWNDSHSEAEVLALLDSIANGEAGG